MVERNAPQQREDEPRQRGGTNGSGEAKRYVRFVGMIATAMLVMFDLTYVNTYDLPHVRWSETRLFMTLLMGGAMAIIMLGFMLGMYQNRKANIAMVGKITVAP